MNVMNMMKIHRSADEQFFLWVSISKTNLAPGTLTLRGAMASFRDAQWSSMCKKGDLNEATSRHILTNGCKYEI